MSSDNFLTFIPLKSSVYPITKTTRLSLSIRWWIVPFGFMIRDEESSLMNPFTPSKSSPSTKLIKNHKTLDFGTFTHRQAFRKVAKSFTKNGCKTKHSSNFRFTTIQRKAVHTSSHRNGKKKKNNNRSGSLITMKNPKKYSRYSKPITIWLTGKANADKLNFGENTLFSWFKDNIQCEVT